MEVFLILIIVIVIIVAINRTPGKNTLQNTENLQPGSKVVSVSPYVKGSKQYKHYEVTIKFADGSSYTTNLGEKGFMTISYNQEHLNKAKQEAIYAHEQAVLKRVGNSAIKEIKQDDDIKTDISQSLTGTYIDEETSAYFSKIGSFFNNILSEIKKEKMVQILPGDPILGNEKNVSEGRLKDAVYLFAFNYMKPIPGNVEIPEMIESYSHMISPNEKKAEEIKNKLLKANTQIPKKTTLHQSDIKDLADWMTNYSLFIRTQNETHKIVVSACEKAINQHCSELSLPFLQDSEETSLNESQKVSELILEPTQKEGPSLNEPQLANEINTNNFKSSESPSDLEQKDEKDITNDNREICYCRKCGFKLLSDSTFCSRCGARID